MFSCFDAVGWDSVNMLMVLIWLEFCMSYEFWLLSLLPSSPVAAAKSWMFDILVLAYLAGHYLVYVVVWHSLSVSFMCFITALICWYLLQNNFWCRTECNHHYVVYSTQLLKSTLDAEGHEDVLIVAPDAQSWDILNKFAADPEFLNSVDIIG